MTKKNKPTINVKTLFQYAAPKGKKAELNFSYTVLTITTGIAAS
jgi:hypothetical protein